MTRSPLLCLPALPALAVAGLVAACPGCRQPSGIGPVFPTASELPPVPRRTDGVAIDPAPELPPSSDTAMTRDQVAVLRPPLPEKMALAVVSSFFRSVTTEDAEKLAALLTIDATATTRSRSAASPMLDYWRARMRRLAYRKLTAETAYIAAQVEIYRYEDLAVARAGRPVRPPTMMRSDLIARVPIATARAGNDRLFGDEIVFLLRREQDNLRIREVTEDFQLP
jgi:hypothetical protein